MCVCVCACDCMYLYLDEWEQGLCVGEEERNLALSFCISCCMCIFVIMLRLDNCS